MHLTFQPLSLDRRNEYKTLLAACDQQTSDYSFVNLWSWQDEYGLEWAWESGLVWVRQTLPEPVLWAPVGPWSGIDWSAVFRGLGQDVRFTRVPEPLIQRWQQASGLRVVAAEAREHWDYLYSVRELIELKGNRFHKKKNLLSQFQRDSSAIYQPLDRDGIEKALTLQTEWCLWRDCEESSVLLAENRAIIRAFRDWDQLEGIFGAGLTIDNNMIAYTVGEPLGKDTVVIHFEKACPSIKGAYQAINQMFLERSASSYTLVNREQDLGDEGLRKAKESYNPVAYLKKFQVTVHTA